MAGGSVFYTVVVLKHSADHQRDEATDECFSGIPQNAGVGAHTSVRTCVFFIVFSLVVYLQTWDINMEMVDNIQQTQKLEIKLWRQL